MPLNTQHTLHAPPAFLHIAHMHGPLHGLRFTRLALGLAWILDAHARSPTHFPCPAAALPPSADTLELCLQQSGVPREVRMEDVWRHFIRSGCPDFPTMAYGAGLQQCWQEHSFVAPAGSQWLCAQPAYTVPDALLAAARSPLAPAPRWHPSALTGLLSLPVHCLERIIWSLGKREGVRMLAALACCCRQLAEFAAGQQALWEARCKQAAPSLDWAAVEGQQQQQPLQQQHQQHQQADAPGSSSGGGAAAEVNWRACYQALRDPAEHGSDSLRNTIRIVGVVHGVLDELRQPLPPQQ